MKLAPAPVLLTLTGLALAACNLGGKNEAKAPAGQVVATVDGKEITVSQLNAELAGFNASDPQARRRAQDKALAMIILREAMAQAAHDQGLDKTPTFAIQKQRVDDNLLAQTLEAKVQATVTPPTPEEVERYMADHPELFSQRRLFVLDQIRMARPSDPKFIKELQPLKALADIESLLQREQVKYQRGTSNLDAAGANPKLIQAILKMPPNEVFVLSDNGVVLVNQVREVRIVPFTGNPAVQYATSLMKRQRTQQAMDGEVNLVMAKAKPSIHFNPAYQPAKPAGSSAETPAKNKAP